MPFTIFDDEKIKPYLDSIEGDSRAPNSGQDDAPQGGDDDQFGARRDPNVTVGMESMEH